MTADNKLYRCTSSRNARNNQRESNRMAFESASKLYKCGYYEERRQCLNTKLTNHREIHTQENPQTGETYQNASVCSAKKKITLNVGNFHSTVTNSAPDYTEEQTINTN